MIQPINEVLTKFWVKFLNYLPDFSLGLLILLIGLLVAGIVKKVLITLFNFFKLERIFSKTGILEKNIVKSWIEILGEILRWTIIILFLVPTLEIWGLSKATAVINQLLFYLPNVIVAVIIGFVGLIIANLVADVVRHSVKTVGSVFANSLAVFSKGIVIFFTILVVLNQLGVAQDLIRILFTGIVAMLSLAGGLAFGLGGKEIAKELLEELRKKIK
ncbi:MAG: hypothetical protein N2482_03595 [Patescibacteria group bacterium]|nr:hypothetical protein [Patescibacteria group bacterium]